MIYTGSYKITKNIKLPIVLGGQLLPVLYAPELAFTEIISVKVEGMSFNIQNGGAPNGRNVAVFSYFGWIVFAQEFISKDVFVMYQK